MWVADTSLVVLLCDVKRSESVELGPLTRPFPQGRGFTFCAEARPPFATSAPRVAEGI